MSEERLYRLSNLAVPLDADEDALKSRAAKAIRIPASRIVGLRVSKRSLDARQKPRMRWVLQLELRIRGALPSRLPRGLEPLGRSSLDVPEPGFLAPSGGKSGGDPAVVVGAGPAGLFAALALSRAGQETVLLERGRKVDERMGDIGALRAHGKLDPESNVCFGEGGAGAYSDGKLYSRVKHPFARWVLKTFVDCGADPEILVDAHPHLGTDKLVAIVRRIREEILRAGGKIRYTARVESLLTRERAVRGVRLAGGEELPASAVILAVGHSARDTIERLFADGVRIEAKPFAVGVRAEHPQELINKRQYGTASIPRLGAASYSLTHQACDPRLSSRGVYTFCMCPGGFVIPAPSEPEHMVVNGMSNSNRSAPYSNSGVVVEVRPEDLPAHGFEESPLAGIAFQRALEAAAFRAASRPYAAPAQRVDDFLAGKASGVLAPTNFRPGAEACDLSEILPAWLCVPLREGLRAFGRKLHGYDSAAGNLFAVESRTSAPVRMVRGGDLAAEGLKGLYPAGEGAGYAGGIVSAAVDGLRAAEAVLERAGR